MTEYEAYQEHIRYTHDTYCRIVIRHASFDAARMLAARWKREISLEYLTEEKFVQLSTTDEYFQVPDYGETYPFSVRGQTILLDSCSLAAALARLPEQTQEEIFLYYFQHLTQKEIGEQSGWTRSTIGRHIRLVLKRLKEKWRCCPMSNRLLPYDTIIKAHEGDPIAIQAVLDRYAGYIRYFSKMNGYYNSDMEDYIRTKLIESLFKFRLDR